MADLNQIAELIKAGEKTQARQQLLNLLSQDRRNERAWLYMAACAASKAEFEQSLFQVLTLNPLNAQALELVEKNNIRLPKELKASLKRQKRNRKVPRTAEKSRSRRGLLLFLLVILLIVAAAALFLNSRTQEEKGAATAEATELATEALSEEPLSASPIPEATEAPTEAVAEESTELATEAASTEEVNPTATKAPTQRPTKAPTQEAAPIATEEAAPTTTPSRVPTRLPSGRTPTPTTTGEAEPTPSAADITLTLVYNEKVIYLQNVSDFIQDVSALVFVQSLENGEALRFEATEWYQGGGRGEGTIYALQPGRCFQVGIDARSASTKPQECTVLNGWIAPAAGSLFWLPTEGGTEFFSVLHGEEEIARCQLSEAVCEFALP